MNGYTLKTDVKISSTELISYLKKNTSLYLSTNNVINDVLTISPLKKSTPNSMVWVASSETNLNSITASVFILPNNHPYTNKQQTLIRVSNPKLAYALLLNHFFLKKEVAPFHIAPSATIAKTVKIGMNTKIEHNVVIGEHVSIGNNVHIHPNTVIYDHTIIGHHVTIGCNTSIGYEGFGYIENEDGSLLQFPQIGRVIIQDHVKIGANTCIDRGALTDTIIKEDTKIDNLVQVSHNVTIQKKALLTAGTIIGGSSTIGEGCFLGLNTSIKNTITIPNQCLVGMGAAVTRSFPDGTKTAMGIPAKVIKTTETT